MPTIAIDGCTLHYELLGSGPPLVLTPGGRGGLDFVRPLAEKLAAQHRVLIWDRRNCGNSDLWLHRSPAEQEIWADDLAHLLRSLGMAPAILAGGSAGARVSLMTALRHPEVVKALALWSVSGGAYACQVLGYSYHVPFIMAAESGGMEAVAETPFFAERIAMNPGNRARLLAVKPADFIEAMHYWNTFFYDRPDCPVIGMTHRDLASIQAPTLVIAGNDPIHPKSASDAIARACPNVTHALSAWTQDQFMARYTGRFPGSAMSLWKHVTPTVLRFTERLT
jgi:pimeloyl-ACP methyl ester carboxylesterase